MLEQTIERWFDDATMKGELKGERKGELKGISKIVVLQMKLRFGPVPDWAQERLDNASEDQLTQWASAILTAQSLNDLFGADGPVH